MSLLNRLVNLLPLSRSKAPDLLVDEADALFTKRSEVKDSHDRYAQASETDPPPPKP